MLDTTSLVQSMCINVTLINSVPYHYYNMYDLIICGLSLAIMGASSLNYSEMILIYTFRIKDCSLTIPQHFTRTGTNMNIPGSV